jgi:hypothetical protein
MDRAEVREKIWRTIEHKWDRRRPPGGVGTTDSKTVYDRLVAKGGRRTTRRNGWDFAGPTRRGAFQRAPLYGRRRHTTTRRMDHSRTGMAALRAMITPPGYRRMGDGRQDDQRQGW